MIKLNDIYYELNLIDIINELKYQLNLNGVYLFNHIKELPEDIMVSCPFHKDGQEKKPSCGIRKSDGLAHCFTCKETVGIEELISRCFGYNDFGKFGISWLKNNFLGDIHEHRELNIDLSRSIKRINNNYVSENELSNYRYYHPYMYQRGLTDDIIDIFDIGYDKKTACITFPVRDIHGNCLFVAKRSVHEKKFYYPANIIKPLYGIYELNAYTTNLNEIYLCESMIDCCLLWKHKKYGIALNGLGTYYQFEMLNNLPYRKIILCTDNDEAGYNARIMLHDKLKNKIITEIQFPKNRKDIGECSDTEIDNLQEIFI